MLTSGGLRPLMAQSPEKGMASYYADKFHGARTASGEAYDKNDYTAAHRTLPFGTRVRVTRLSNGRSVTVRINDRGPFIEGRIVDLSRAAAEKLGMIRDGEVQVRIEEASRGPQPPTAASQRPKLDRDLEELPLRDFSGNLIDEEAVAEQAAQGNPAAHSPALAEAQKYTPSFFQVLAFKKEVKGYGVQVGAYFSYYRLMNALDELNGKGYQQVFVHNTLIDGKPAFRVIAGQFGDREAAKTLQKQLAKDKVKGIVVSYQALGAK